MHCGVGYTLFPLFLWKCIPTLMVYALFGKCFFYIQVLTVTAVHGLHLQDYTATNLRNRARSKC